MTYKIVREVKKHFRTIQNIMNNYQRAGLEIFQSTVRRKLREQFYVMYSGEGLAAFKLCLP